MVYNFNAGPSTLPQTVLEEASKAIINFNNSGLSILEIGHRTPLFEAVIEEARSLVRELMNLDDNHEVLYLHGGATVQFMQVPMNLLDENETVAIAETDVWGTKAIKEAKLFGNVNVVCTSKDNNFNYIPKDFTIPDAKYFHITSNNTIYGTQWQKIPEVKVPLVADMSSDILSRKLDFNSFDLIYAGAQKNMGAAGTNLVVVNKNILGKIKRAIPAIMDYTNHINAKSMLNTPPVFAIYVSMLTLRWLKENGGVEAIEKRNNEKAALLYNAIDNSSIFIPTVVKKEDRSKMNVCFVMKDKDMEKDFLEFSQKNNIYGIKGHRTVGGFRASLYNALPLSSVEYLVEKMKEFERGI